MQGKELSYNNFNDTDAAFECVAEFDAPTIAIIKHATPCGVASATRLADAWMPRSAATRSRPMAASLQSITTDAASAEKIAAIFTEVIIAPDADEAARAVVGRKKNLRLLLTGGMPDPAAAGLTYRGLSGGFLAQTRDNGRPGAADLKVVTKRAPTDAERTDMLFAFRVCKHVKSNAIVYAKAGATVESAAGSRTGKIGAHCCLERRRGREGRWPVRALTKGSVVASDAFFPFADGLEIAIAAGATAVIQPGGSIRDAEVIAAADAAGVAMVFTGMRHFRH